MSVRAKFKVSNIVRSMGGHYEPTEDGGKRWVRSEVQTITLNPVTDPDGNNSENASFYASTPSGEIKLGCVNAEAVKQFGLDQEFYVDFTPASVV
jgi:hypothetical protein